MATHHTFILFPTRSPDIKMIYEMVTNGGKVLSRKSLGIKIQEKNWDKIKKRVKHKEPNCQEINTILKEREEQFSYDHTKSKRVNTEESCALKYMEQELERGYQDGTKKVSTYNKYRTVLETLNKVVNEKFNTKYLSFCKLRDLEVIRELTLGLKKGYGKSGKSKKNEVVSNYLSVLKIYINHWNRHSGTQFPINTNGFLNFIEKSNIKKLAPSITREQIIELENYVPTMVRKRSYAPQILAKNIFLFQYYAAGIRFIDAITMTNDMIKEDKLIIPIRKTSDFISIPFHFPMMQVMKDYFPEQFNSAMENEKLGKLVLDARSIQQLFRIEDLDYANIDYNQLIEITKLVSEQQSDADLINHLSQVRNRLENKILTHFFQLVKRLPKQFLFPQLNYNDFRESIENGKGFSKEQEYLIHRARTRHNGSLKRIGENLGIEYLTGHVPRHTLANHMAYSGNNEEEIRQVLGHSNISTTKIYLRERHGFSGSYDIMKRFHERNN